MFLFLFVERPLRIDRFASRPHTSTSRRPPRSDFSVGLTVISQREGLRQGVAVGRGAGRGRGRVAVTNPWDAEHAAHDAREHTARAAIGICVSP